MKRRRRWLWVSALTLLGGALALLVAVHAPPAHSWIRGRIIATLRESGIEARIDDISYNAFSLRARLEGVRLAPTRLPEMPFFEAESIGVDLPWSWVFGGDLYVQHLYLAQPRLLVQSDAAGRNLPRAFENDSASSASSTPFVEELFIEAAAIEWSDEVIDASLQLSGIDLSLSRADDALPSGRFESRGRGLARWGGRSTPIDDLAASLSFGGNVLNADDLSARLSFGTVSGDVHLISGQDGPHLDANLAADLDVERLAAFVDSPALPTSGRLVATARLEGPLLEPQARLEVGGRSLTWFGIEAIGLELAAALQGSGATIDTMRLSSADGVVEGSGFVPFSADSGGRISLAWAGVDASALLAALSAPTTIPVTSSLDGNAEATWQGSGFSGPTVRGFTRITSSMVATDRLAIDGEAGVELDAGRWSATFDGRLDDWIEIDGGAAGNVNDEDLLKSTLTGSVSIAIDSVERAGGRLAELGIWAPGAADAPPPVGAPPSQISGALRSRWDLAGSLGVPRLAGRLTGTAVRLGPVDLGEVEADVELDALGIVVRSLRASPAAATVGASLRLDFSSAALGGDVQIDVPAIEALLDIPEPWRPRAAVHVLASVSGTVENPAVAFDLESDGILIAGQTIDRMTAQGSWTGGTLQADRFELHQQPGTTAAGLLRGSATYRLETGEHELNVHGRNWRLGDLPPGILSESGAPLRAHLGLRWESTGVLSDPEARSTFTISDLEYGGTALGPARAEINISGGLLRLDATSSLLAGRAEATLGLDPWGDFSLRVRHEGLDLRRLRDHLGLTTTDVDGEATFVLEASGRLDDVAATRATLELHALDATVNETPVRLVEPGLIALEPGELRVDPLEIKLGGAQLLIGGRTGASNELQAHLSGDLGDVSDVIGAISAFAGAAGVAAGDTAFAAHGVEMRGDVELGLLLSGPLDAPIVSGFLEIAGGEVSQPDFPAMHDIGVSVRWGNGALEVDSLEARWQGATLSASAFVPWVTLRTSLPALAALGAGDDARPARLNARIGSLTPEVLRPFVDEETVGRLDGTVSALLEIEAEDLSIAGIRGEIVLDRAELRAAGTELVQQTPTRLRWAAGALLIEEWTWMGPTGEMTMTGGVELGPPPEVSLALRGEVDLRLLRALTPRVATSGYALIDLNITGPVGGLGFSGTVLLDGAELRLAAPRIALTEVSGRLAINPDRIVVESIAGLANGGSFSLSGELDLAAGGVAGGTLNTTARNVALEPLPGLGTLIDADLSLDATAPMTVRGNVMLLRGEYRERLSATGGILAALRQRQQLAPATGDPSPLDDLRFDIRIDSTDGLLVDNNLARLTADLDLVLSGTVAHPALGGRAELLEGGEIFLSGNRFRLQRGSIDFIDPESVQPDLDLSARGRISTYDVELSVTGTPDTLEVDVSSTPALDQSDLVSLIVTGRTLDEAGSMPTQVAREQVVGLLTAEMSDRAGRAIGLDSVRIERGGLEEDYRFDASVVASETDPGSRLSLYKRISDNLDLVFSQSLKDSGSFTWIIGYRFLRNFTLRWLIDDETNRAYELSQDLGFGAPPAALGAAATGREGSEARSQHIRAVLLEGALLLDEALVRGHLKTRPGDRFHYFRWQEDRERLERFYHENGYFEVRVNARRITAEDSGDTALVDLVYDIDPGPETILRFEGWEFRSSVRREMEEAWTRSVFDGFLVDELESAARRELADDGYVSASVEVRIEPAPAGGPKNAVVRVSPGDRAGNRRIEFRGNRAVESDELSRAVEAAGLRRRGWTDRAALEGEVAAFYQRRGMMDAVARVGEPERAGGALILPVAIEEGKVYRFAEVELSGIAARDPDDVRAELGFSPGQPFAAAAVEAARRAMEAGYRSRGFADVRVEPSVLLRGERSAAEVAFSIDEGRPQILAEVVVSGAVRTRRSVIDRNLRLTAGVHLDPADVYNARQRLYQTGVFRRVEMVVEPLDSAPPSDAADGMPVRLLVHLQERAPFRFRYGVRLNDINQPLTDGGRELRFGLSSDLSNRNVLGRAVTAGISVRYQSDFRAVRGFVGARSFFGLSLGSNVYLTRSREQVGQQEILPFVADKTVLTLEQRVRPNDIMVVAYSYNFERNHTFEPEPIPGDPFAFDITVDLAILRLSTLLDTRDDVLDARRGWSHSSNLDYAVPSLGSDLRYVKYLAQQYYFHPLTDNVVLASAARLGLATSFGQELIPSERFFAGGGNSVRGYAQDSLGPRDFFGIPVGGEALLVLKQEIRFPVWRRLRGVAFFDAGNAFESVQDIALSGLATSWGFGLRVDTPFALLRGDFGFPLGRAPGEPTSRFFFSIGQSF